MPFVIGALCALVALYLRRNIDETAAFEHGHAARREPLFRELMKHPREVLTVVGLTMGGTVAFYTYTTYMQKFLANTAGMSKDEATLVSATALFVYMLLQPVVGALSDRVGRRPVLLAFGILGTLCTVPLLTAISHASSGWEAFWLIMAALVIVSGYTSINAVVKAELFPTHIRALGVGLPYAVAVSLFGGTAEYFALWFKEAAHETGFYWYVTACIFCSLIVYGLMPDTRQTSRIDRDEATARSRANA